MTMQLAPYLFFDGTCEDALTFYARALGGQITAINRYGESPGAENMPAAERDRVMHATLVAPGMTLMASDGHRCERCDGARVAVACDLGPR